MVKKIYSSSFLGLDCRVIEVEADISNGMSMFSIVGLGDTSVQESKERVRSSIRNSGLKFPTTRKTVNLAPAQIRKQGSLFDFPIAISLLVASNQIEIKDFEKSIFIGELSLNGQLKPVRGVLPITQHAKEKGFTKIFLPQKNAMEAGFVDGIDIFPLRTIKEFIQHCENIKIISPFKKPEFINETRKYEYLFPDIIGHEKAKRALVLSAIGGHNLLFSGSPGCGKTILARSIKYLLPEMSKEEMLGTTKIFSIAGLLNHENYLISTRPFREIHPLSSAISIIGGGGSNPKPGEISLAHNGVLFLDEISEFPGTVLETLRQPVEDKYINIGRANFSTRFPCNFTLIATTNPCACGYKYDKKIKCVCSLSQFINYQKRLSGPLMDRFDIFLEIERGEMKEIFTKSSDESSEDLNKKINQAILIQKKRFSGSKTIFKNADMGIRQIKKHCIISKNAQTLLNRASKNLYLSNRAYLKTLKLALTIADLEQDTVIRETHLAEALQYRK